MAICLYPLISSTVLPIFPAPYHAAQPRHSHTSQAPPLSASHSQAFDPELLAMARMNSSSSSSSLVLERTVSVFWDLDNKPPKLSPYDAALHLRDTASKFGDVVDMVAYANRHAFLHIPEWVRKERQDRKHLNQLERKGLAVAETPYICGMCGRKCKTNIDLKKHFKQLHERERQKRMSRLQSLKGRTKRMKFREKIHAKEDKYMDAARTILIPKSGYGLASELRRAGVFVQTVEDKPQAADRALKRRIMSSMNRGITCICLVSDDCDFSALLLEARAKRLRTIVIGDTKALKRYADVWFPWDNVAHGLSQDEYLDAVDRLSMEEGLMQEILDDNNTKISRFDNFKRRDHSSALVNSEPVIKVSAFSEEEEYLSDGEDTADYESGEDEWSSDDEI